jgi:LacI family transcriptional regulator
MRVTIRDVAREAEVSVATVSRVLNESGPVSARTRERVREVAGRLRYSPSGAARSLIMSRTSTVGVLLPDLYGEFFSEVIRGIDQTAQRHGYHLFVSSSHNDKSEIEAALRAMRGRVDGVLLMSPDIDAPALGANLPESLPIVLLNCAVHDSAYDSLNIDNFGGARAMVEHLVGLGHREIAIIKGSDRNFDARERLAGYRAGLRAAGIERRPERELQGDFTESSGYDVTARLLATTRVSDRPTVVVAANDSMAIGALSALRDAGVKVPEEMAVVGFDDIPIARYMSPPLSTVRVGITELGERATGALLQAVAEKNQHVRRQETLPTMLVVRSSCGEGRRSLPRGEAAKVRVSG